MNVKHYPSNFDLVNPISAPLLSELHYSDKNAIIVDLSNPYRSVKHCERHRKIRISSHSEM